MVWRITTTMVKECSGSFFLLPPWFISLSLFRQINVGKLLLSLEMNRLDYIHRINSKLLTKYLNIRQLQGRILEYIPQSEVGDQDPTAYVDLLNNIQRTFTGKKMVTLQTSI